MSLRDDILARTVLPVETLYVPEWDAMVHIRTLTATEKTAFEIGQLARNARDHDETLRLLKVQLLSLTIVDEAGQRVFTDDDIEAIGRLHTLAVDRCFRVAQRLNLEVGDIGELSKNSGGTQG